MNSNSPSYRKVPVADDTLQPVDAVAVPIQSESCNNELNEDAPLSFEHDWDRYLRQEKAEKVSNHIFLVCALLVGYMVFFFLLGLHQQPRSEWFKGGPLFLFLVTIASIGMHLKHIYDLKTNGNAIPCPQTRISPRNGLYYSYYSEQGEESACFVLIPFSEIENILITLPDNKVSYVTITTKAMGDGAEFVQSGVPKFVTCTTFTTTSVNQQTSTNNPTAGTGHHGQREERVALTIHALREPYIFKKKMLELMEQDPKQKLENVINRIDHALSEHYGGDAESPAIFSEIRDELKSLKENMQLASP